MVMCMQSLFLLATLGGIAVYATAPLINIADDFPVYKSEKKAVDDVNYRLDKNEIIPSHYDITISLGDDFLTTKKFTGTVKITIKLKEGLPPSTKPVYIHAHRSLTRNGEYKIYPTSDNTANIVKSSKSMDNKYEIDEITLADTKTIDKNDYIIEASYNGELQTDMTGFYLSGYKNKPEDANDVYVLATQFQPTHARKLMPCFDEPQYKASFQLTLNYPRGYNALSNTIAETSNENEQPEIIKKVFKETPIMSTYLLAILVSKFHGATTIFDGINHHVWNRFENAARSEYSLQKSYQLINAMQEYTKVNYKESKIGKIDHVALPDFAAGAMENWGLVTYRESALLYDAKESTTRSKQQVCTIIAHELAHFWFGNYVTTKWWDNTWLNEGFARYFEYMAAHKVEPDFELDYQFVVEQHLAIMNSDALPTAEAINSPASTPEEIKNKFGSITYNKGASLIRMMLNWAKDEQDVRTRLQSYINAAMYDNVEPDNLWKAMESIQLPEGVKVAEAMNTYITKPGVPLVKVEKKDNDIILSQQRFIFPNQEQQPQEAYYYIPITYTANNKFEDTKPTHWIKPVKDASLTIGLKENTNNLVIVNLQSTGYMRVNYDDTLWGRIINALAQNNLDEHIHVLNRAQLVDDALNLARAGILEYEKALNIVSYLEHEHSYYPWYAAHSAFEYLLRRLPPTSTTAQQLRLYLLHLTNAVYRNEVVNETSHIKALKNSLIKAWRCNLGDDECVAEMVALFEGFKTGQTTINPDTRSTAYCVGLRQSQDKKDWDYLFNRMKSTTLPSEASLILKALGCTTNETLLNEYLLKSIELNSGIRSQDADLVFLNVISGSPKGLEIGIQFLKDKYKEMITSYGGINGLKGVLNRLFDRFTTIEEVNSFKAFVDGLDASDFKDVATNMLKTARANIAWTEENKEKINTFVTRYLNNLTPTPAPTPKPPKDDDNAAGFIVSNSVAITFSVLIAMYSRL